MALLIFFGMAMVQSETLTHQGAPTIRLRSCLEGLVVMALVITMAPPWDSVFYANLHFSEICQLGTFHALAALAFIQYLKLYIDFRHKREPSTLVFFFEVIGLCLLASTFVAAWSTMLIIYSRSLAYDY